MGGLGGVVSSNPQLNPSGRTATKTIVIKSPKSWLRNFQAAAKRTNSASSRGSCVVQSPLSLSSSPPAALSVCPPPLAHCLEPDRKPGRPGPESERRLFLLPCDCFLFRPEAILHAPGGPVLVRVPACSRAVPEG